MATIFGCVCMGKNDIPSWCMHFNEVTLAIPLKYGNPRGAGAGPAGTAAAEPMLEAKLMNLIKGRLQKF